MPLLLTIVALFECVVAGILKLDPSSPLANKFKVGDRFVCVNGKDCSAMSVAAMMENEEHVSLTALRKRANSGMHSDRGWAGN